MSAAHSTFRFIRKQDVASLNLSVEEFEHRATGAQHIHLSPQTAGENENVFLVALRTVPHDNTGVAHILEHTALCGSKKYPVRDPFFMMTRRSINTFMNAFTSSDWTAYPFASLSKKDFNNLLDVYLDAVFFSRLDELDFAQEGHRLEFSSADDPTTPLEFKGVVFNEMKGAMSSVPSQLWHTMCRYLFPSTTYHFNSGGDPEAIPDLSYEQLKAFYQTHYHPSNAIFMTYGDISAANHQQKFEDQALKHFTKLDYTVSVPDEKRFCSAIRVQESYPNSDEDISEKTHVVLGWLLGKSTNLRDSLRAQLLSSVLLDNSASPLMLALESSDLGDAPSPMCGLDSSQKELSFLCGLAGCKPDAADQVEQLALLTLEKVAEEGVPQEELESALHQLELHQREVGGDREPYGLQLILTALTNATHRGDPVGLLNIDEALEQLREDIKSEDFVKQLTRDLLLNNGHFVRLTMTPDGELSNKRNQAEKQRLQELHKNLSEDEKQKIIAQAQALKERQAQIDDESILPKVSLADVPEKEVSVDGLTQQFHGTTVTEYGAGTNGLVYQQAIFSLPNLTAEQRQLLPLYSSLVTELGAGDSSYLDMQRLQASVSGSFNAFSSIRIGVNNPDETAGFFAFSGKALHRNQSELSQLMLKTISSARFDETQRIQEIIAQTRVYQEQSVTGSGHVLAMTAASAGSCGLARFQHEVNGLAGIAAIKKLDNAIQNAAELESLASAFSSIHSAITSAEKQLLLVGEDQFLDSYRLGLQGLCDVSPTASPAPFSLEKSSSTVRQAWITNTQVNFCAKAYRTVAMGHEDSAALVVLGNFLRNGFLHTHIREQGGAYGGGASQDSGSASFRFYSYRDPRLEETLNDFDQSLKWLIEENHPAQKLEEAILGTVSSLDRSESPAGRAKRCFHAELHGRSQAKRQAFRERVLKTTFDDLVRVTHTYLRPENASVAVVTNNSKRKQADTLGLQIVEL